MTTRLRYQQTKIGGAPDTILMNNEVVAIIRAQQQWAATWLRERAAPGACPRYLLLGLLFNRNAEALRGSYPAPGAHRAGPTAGYPRQRRAPSRLPAAQPVPARVPPV